MDKTMKRIIEGKGLKPLKEKKTKHKCCDYSLLNICNGKFKGLTVECYQHKSLK